MMHACMKRKANYSLIIVVLLITYGCSSNISRINQSNASIAYSYFDEKQGWQIWQLDLKNLTSGKLSQSQSEAYYPTESKLGKIFYSDHDGRIWSLAPDIKSMKQVAKSLTSLPKYCGHPAASPDGQYLACVCFTFINRSEDSDLFLLDLTSGKSERLITLDGIQKHPAWSPDSRQLAFSTGFRQRGQQIVEQLWVMDIKDKIPVKIVDNNHSNINPAWSPDGQYIAYASDAGGSMDIWLYDRNHQHSDPLVTHSALDVDPIWRQDRKSIIFVSTRDGNMGLWEIDLDNKVTEKLLTLPNDIHEPAWLGGAR